MSHFTVLVVTENGTEEELEKALAPFHDFECTGIDNEYVQDIDVLAERLEDYRTSESTRMVNPHGKTFCAYDDQFYCDATEEEIDIIKEGKVREYNIDYRRTGWPDDKYRVRFIPEGWTKKEMKNTEFQSFRDFLVVDHELKYIGDYKYGDKEVKYGYYDLDEMGEVSKVIKRTNPDAKWDWYNVGGGWSDMLISLNGDEHDSLQMSNLDPERIRSKQIKHRYDQLNEVRTEIEITWDELEKVFKEDSRIRELYSKTSCSDREHEDYVSYFDYVNRFQEGPALQSLFAKFPFFIRPNLTNMSLKEWCESAPGITTHAVLKDGKWVKKGEMGWWGISTSEDEDWVDNYYKFLDSIDPDHFITVVDCHI